MSYLKLVTFFQRNHITCDSSCDFESMNSTEQELIFDHELTVKEIKSEKFAWRQLESSPAPDPQDNGNDYPISCLTFHMPW